MDRIEPVIGEMIRAWNNRPDYEVNAFFADDRPPLAADEIELAMQLVRLTRADLLAAIEGLSADDLAQEIPPFWPIGGVLNHSARAENWYLSRLGQEVAGISDLPDVLARLAAVRQRLLEVLPGLASDSRVVDREGELWSPRKLLRWAVWHERDHTRHILQIRQHLDR